MSHNFAPLFRRILKNLRIDLPVIGSPKTYRLAADLATQRGNPFVSVRDSPAVGLPVDAFPSG